MKTRKLHNLTVSEVGMGCMAFHAPALLPKGQALAAPRWNPQDSRGLVAPAKGSGATAVSTAMVKSPRSNTASKPSATAMITDAPSSTRRRSTAPACPASATTS